MGRIKSFQMAMAWSNATVANAGLISGVTTCVTY